MTQLGKVDWTCIGLMIVGILIASGYLAVVHGWVHMWIVIGLVVVSLAIIGVTSRRRKN